MRFLKLKFLLPLIAGALLVILFLGMGSRQMNDVINLEIGEKDITEDFGCFPRSRLPRLIYCYVADFSFSESYGQFILAGTFDELCNPDERHERIIKRIAGVTFILSPRITDQVFCNYGVSIHFRNGDRFSGGLLIQGGPRRQDPATYELRLTYPGGDRPIAGLVYNTELHETFYFVSSMVYQIPSCSQEPPETLRRMIYPHTQTSLANATFWAEQSGITVRTPTETKDRHHLTITMWEDTSRLGNTQGYHVEFVDLVYSQERIDLGYHNMTLVDLLASGSFLIIMGDGSDSPGMTAFETFCLNNIEPVMHLIWEGDGTSYQIWASARYFTDLEILRISDSIY